MVVCAGVVCVAPDRWRVEATAVANGTLGTRFAELVVGAAAAAAVGAGCCAGAVVGAGADCVGGIPVACATTKPRGAPSEIGGRVVLLALVCGAVVCAADWEVALVAAVLVMGIAGGLVCCCCCCNGCPLLATPTVPVVVGACCCFLDGLNAIPCVVGGCVATVVVIVDELVVGLAVVVVVVVVDVVAAC